MDPGSSAEDGLALAGQLRHHAKCGLDHGRREDEVYGIQSFEFGARSGHFNLWKSLGHLLIFVSSGSLSTEEEHICDCSENLIR